MLKHSTAKNHSDSSSNASTHSGYDYQGSYEYGKSKVLSVGVPFVNNPVANIIDSGISSSDYISSIKHANSAQADKNYQEVAPKAISILNETKQVTDTILRADCHIPEIVYMGDSICKRLGQHFLHEAEYNDCAYQETRDEWKAKGERYLTCNIYDIMKDSGILPSWGVPYLTPLPLEEDPEMIAQLRAQLEQLILEKEQRDNTILQQQTENNNLTEANSDLTNRLITSEENNIILQNENHNLTDRLIASEESNAILQEKLVISEAKVMPLQEKVQELKDDKKALEADKIELREDKKMLVEYNKSLQEEKKLLIVDKKMLHDLSTEQRVELLDLKHIHFDTEHCTIVGHCNNPDHEGI